MRTDKIRIFLFLILFFSIGKIGWTFDDGDFQYWNTESVSWKIKDHWKMKLEEAFRWGDDASDFYYHHSDIGITYSGLTDWLDVGLNYRYIIEEKKDDWRHENRPYLNITFKGTLNDFKVSNRSRLEYREKDISDDAWRYRNKSSLKFTKWKIQPYLADEIFVDFEKEELNRNRIYSGFSFKIFKNLKGEIYYFWQTSKSSDKWKDMNVFGTKLKLSF